MPDMEKVISALHCRAQDLMIDLPTCDGCDYKEVALVHIRGCNCRKLYKDAIELLKEQETKKKNRLPYPPDSNVQWT